MKIYEVGGAVRDSLLGCTVQDRDWLVVGATPQMMVDKGFQPVGRDFPVFLHPITHEEYALARTERKLGTGHGGFSFYANPTVTVEEDLIRRDLTINAIAKDSEGNLIDPFGGQEDLRRKVLRHVSPAFSEDPLRVFRVARFSARFGNFSIADETLMLIQKMAESGELQSLSAERVWQEMVRGLSEDYPEKMFEVLAQTGALMPWLSEVSALKNVPQDKAWHPERDVFEHTLLSLKAAAKLSPDPLVRYATLCHDVGKSATDKADLPHHPHHATLGIPLAKALSERLKAPKPYINMAVMSAKWHDHLFHLRENPHDINGWLALIQGIDAIRRKEHWQVLRLVVEADYRGRPGYADKSFAFMLIADEIMTEVTAPYGEAERPTDEVSRQTLLHQRMQKALAKYFL